MKIIKIKKHFIMNLIFSQTIFYLIAIKENFLNVKIKLIKTTILWKNILFEIQKKIMNILKTSKIKGHIINYWR